MGADVAQVKKRHWLFGTVEEKPDDDFAVILAWGEGVPEERPQVQQGAVAALIHQFAFQIRGYAKEAGEACSMPVCDAMTLGVRCEKCTRRVCMGHAFWKLAAPKVVPFCPYCVVDLNPDAFTDEDDE